MLQIYNHMIQSYLPKQTVRNHAHKRTELKRVYDNIIKQNKNSGFYKVNLSKENQLFTFGIKETALALKSKLDDLCDPEENCFKQKAISISDSRVLTADLLDEDMSGLPETLSMTVETIATSQINKGKDLFHSSRGLETGVYPFKVLIMNESYELSFQQKERTSNYTSMNNIADYLNKNLPGITVTVESGEKREYSCLILQADFTGKVGERAFTFEDPGYFNEGIVDFFGLNRMIKSADNAKFMINGIEKYTNGNTFNIEKALQISLNEICEQPVSIGIIPDSKPILKQLDQVLNIYNDFIHIANARKIETKEYYNADKLINELKGIEKTFEKELHACGLVIEEDGTLSRNEELSDQAAITGEIESFIKKENGFIAKLLEKTESIAINPMNYLDKITVTYPNNTKVEFPNPYVTSVYSGLFFSSYC